VGTGGTGGSGGGGTAPGTGGTTTPGDAGTPQVPPDGSTGRDGPVTTTPDAPGPRPDGAAPTTPDAPLAADGTAPGPITIPSSYPTGPGPAGVTVGPNGRLVYAYEPNGDAIPDFSYGGYMGGGVPIPTVPAVVTLSPMPGETNASGRIQAAIDDVSRRPPGGDGYRGAVLLRRGLYPLTAGMTIRESGVVVRGEGDGEDGTVLQITNDGGTAVKIFSIDGSGRALTEVPGSRRRLTDPYVPVGARWFRVDSTQGLAVGDEVIVLRPSTTEWIDALGMAQYGWTAGQYDMRFDRTIVAIQDNRVMVDAPIVQSIDQRYGGGFVYKYTGGANRLQRVGIEGIRGSSTVPHPDGLNVRGNFIDIRSLANGFFRNLTNWYLQGSPMRINGSRSITVQDMISIHKPWPGPHMGASPSVFTFDGSQLLLFQRLTSSDGGFEFSSGGRNPGPNVYTRSVVPHGYAFSGPHQRWANATLYDALQLQHGLDVRNAGSGGSGHGWQGANHVFWNVAARSFVCQKPPTANQWHIGGVAANGMRSGDCTWVSFGTHVKPDSLYRAQLTDRIGPAAVAALGPTP
jgi:hypothetical protein